MRIAVASIGLDIAPSFSHCEDFNYYTTKSYEIIASQNMPAQGYTFEGCAQLLDNMGVDAIICNEIGETARSAFDNHGIMVVDGKTGNALQAAEDLVEQLSEQLDEQDGSSDDGEDDD